MSTMTGGKIETVDIPGCFIRIHGTYASLRAAEQRVADFILKHPEELIHLTVTELADKTQTSESTVVRLCQKIGYKGYQEFKIMLARDLVGPTETVYEEIVAGDDIPTLKQKVFAANAQALKDTMEVLQNDELERAVAALSQARRVEVYGIGGSAPPALDTYHKLMRLGINAVCLSDGDVMAMSSALLVPGDVVLGISHTGASRDVCDAMENAQSAGVTTICITHRATSPITKVADIKLFTAAKETVFGSDAMSSRIAQLSIVDTLYAGIANANYEKSLINVQKTRQASASKRY
jgi:DNA-binding MurR/RpiR family transcriptional regulator